MNTIDKILSRMHCDISKCWNWPGVINGDGYGITRFQGRPRVRVHRLIFEVFRGKIPDGLTLDHLCRNRRCANPFHLEAVTLQTNIQRGSKATATHCIHGHKFTTANTYIRPNGTRRCRACDARRHEIS